MVLLLFLLGAACAHGQTYSRLSSRFLARGEQALLEVCVAGTEPEAAPQIPGIKGVTVQSAGFGAQPRYMAGRRLEYAFRYIISSYETGKHVIPAMEVMVNGEKTKTEPIEFQIFDPNDLQWAEEMVGGRRLTYAAMFRTMTDTPYEGETVPVEIKLYVPRQLAVEDWGIPEFERDGVACWRFEPTDMRGQVNLLGTPYTSVSYPSTLSATKTGKVGIGPATVRLITRQILMDGYARPVSEEVFLKIPKLEMEARELPEGAPAGFDNAVGTFSLQASTTDKEVREGDPISVDIMVTGRGNFDTLRAPRLLDDSGWKVYDATEQERGDERRQLDGIKNFRQFLRPLGMKNSVPPFRLVYFDPATDSYKTVTTPPLPLKMLPAATTAAGAAAVPPALPVPLESMTDILANLPVKNPLAPPRKALPLWIIHIIGGLLALVLIGITAWKKWAPRFLKNSATEAQLTAIKNLSKTTDDAAFLKGAGSLIEQRGSLATDPALQAILAERDEKCFRADHAPVKLDRSRRDEILRILKNAIVACILLAACTPWAKAADVAQTAQTAYDQARYEEAIKQWLSAGKFDELSADTLFNIGNACYRIGSPGQASLYYRRALLREPHHAEAAQNLRFIERKQGAITVAVPDYQRMIARIPLSIWEGMFWVGSWLLLLSLLVFPATRAGARLRPLAVAGLILAPLLLCTGGVGWRYFPDEARFAPLTHQAVIVAEKASLYTDAARTSPVVTDAPQGSLCAILRQTGDWAYVAFASKTRGWVPMKNIEKLIPDKPLDVPKVRKQKVDPNNA